MRTAPLLVGLAVAAAPLAIAQQHLSPFDAAMVEFPDTTSVVRTADLDGDGDPDALGWYWIEDNWTQARISLYRGLGDGSFAPLKIINGPLTGGQTGPWSLEVGRFNGDARDDFAYSFNKSVDVYSSDPAGLPIVLAQWTEAWPVRSMAIADFDLDGLDDLALAGSGVRLYRNNGAGFDLVATLPAGTDLRVGDLDSAAGPDLLVMIGTSLQIVSAAGGSLTPLATFVHGVPAIDVPHQVVGDIDQDGDTDVVVFSDLQDCVVLRRTGPDAWALEPTVVGGPATDFADIDGDGDLDGLCCGSGGPLPAHNETPSTYRISINDGSGSFGKAYEMKGLGAFRLAGAVDVDHDGDLDLVAGRTIIFNRGGFGLDIDPQPATPISLDERLTVVDRERDGDADIIRPDNDWLGGYNTWLNDGSGALSFAWTPTLPTPSGVLIFGPGYNIDVEGDGDLDLIAYETMGIPQVFKGMRTFLNAGGGEYTYGPFATTPGVGFQPFVVFQDGPGSGVATDLDKDGDQDLVVGSMTNNQSKVWLNNGSGQFSAAANTIILLSAPFDSVDLDQDGVPDVIGGSLGFGVAIAFGNGNGTFAATISLPTFVDVSSDRIVVADLDQDGLTDVAAWHHGGDGKAIDIWSQGPARAFQKHTESIADTYYHISNSTGHRLFGLDLDLDGDTDLIAGSVLSDGATAQLLFNDGTGHFPTRLGQVLTHPRAMADVDGDGDADLIGNRLVRNANLDGSTAGFRRQYGTSKAGLGGMSPRLGASGPFAVGQEIVLRITGGRGGSVALFMAGLAQTAQPNWPAPGVLAYTFPPFLTALLPLGGSAGQPGTGEIALPVVVPPAASGLTFFHQALIHDVDATPKPGIWTYTNGLELRYP